MNHAKIKSIYKLIRNFEFEVGESFVDQNESIVDDKCMMFWMLGRGYIHPEQIDSYVHTKFTELNNILCGYDDAFALFPFGEASEECHFKAMLVLAEFISGIEIYQNRLAKILKEADCESFAKRSKELDIEYEKAVASDIRLLRIKTFREEKLQHQ